MSKRWFFGMSGRDVHLRARAEEPGGTDAFHTVRPGERFVGFSYDELKAARAGVVVVENDGTARIDRA